MSNIYKAFENGKAFMPFFICGDPDLDTTAAAVKAAVANGASLIELNIPFSDPTAGDGNIQEANIRALKGGVTTDKIFDLIEELRKEVTVPFVISGYANVVFSYGPDRFLSRCAKIGVDGLIVPDLPFEEREEFLPWCEQYGVDLIAMVAATSRERVTAIASEAKGFLYIMACPGGTTQELRDIVEVVRTVTDIPCAVCLSSEDAPQFWETAELVDGVIEDAPIVALMGRFGTASPRQVGAYTRRAVKQLQSI
ncbi:MAG: tryptophan synthase subunit alpha [Ruminococcaceae bacterium]|nr:tryptophan synthase subunit alpha [Oscillospiraceae bacterium]